MCMQSFGVNVLLNGCTYFGDCDDVMGSNLHPLVYMQIQQTVR